jgi:hypothetical protein
MAMGEVGITDAVAPAPGKPEEADEADAAEERSEAVFDMVVAEAEDRSRLRR